MPVNLSRTKLVLIVIATVIITSVGLVLLAMLFKVIPSPFASYGTGAQSQATLSSASSSYALQTTSSASTTSSSSASSVEAVDPCPAGYNQYENLLYGFRSCVPENEPTLQVKVTAGTSQTQQMGNICVLGNGQPFCLAQIYFTELAVNAPSGFTFDQQNAKYKFGVGDGSEVQQASIDCVQLNAANCALSKKLPEFITYFETF